MFGVFILIVSLKKKILHSKLKTNSIGRIKSSPILYLGESSQFLGKVVKVLDFSDRVLYSTQLSKMLFMDTRGFTAVIK